MSARSASVLGLVIAALVAGCGSSSSSGGSDETTPAREAPAPITIQAPADGARLKARVVPGDRLRARTRVSGRARAGSDVFLSAECRPKPCRAQVRAGDDGRWAAALTLRVTRASPFVAIDANAQRDVVTSGSAVATVELVGPARKRASGSSE